MKKTVGERIRQAREFRRMSGEELALKAGYKTQSGISNLENRGSGHGGNKLPVIAEALNFSLEWFLQGPDTSDMTSVKQFRTYTTEISTPQPQHHVSDSTSPWKTLRERAHDLVDCINEKGLTKVIEMMELVAEKHPRNDDSAGLSLPARKARAS